MSTTCRHKHMSTTALSNCDLYLTIFVFLLRTCRYIDLNSDKLDLSQVNMSKEEHWPILAYGRSKLCIVLFSNALNEKLKNQGVVCNSCHPGNMIYTGLSRNWWVYRILWLMCRPFTKYPVSIV